jgi:hypothetical protein
MRLNLPERLNLFGNPIRAAFFILLFIGQTGFENDAFATSVRIPFNKITRQSVLHMRCVENSFDIFLPIAERWKVKKASITFDYVSSVTLIAGSSLIGFKVNDTPIWQREVDPKEPEQRASFRIPPNLLKHRYNRLSFFVAQHFTADCEQPCDANIWTDILLSDGYLDVEYELLPVPLRLSKAPDFLFDTKTFERGYINIVLPGGVKSAPDWLLTISTVLASGVAKRFSYIPVSFSTSSDIKPGMDNMLVGTKKEVMEFLSLKEIKANIKGPFIKVANLPIPIPRYLIKKSRGKKQKNGGTGRIKRFAADPHFALLVISGDNQNQLQIASETLTVLNFPYPGVSEMTVLEFDLKKIQTYTGKSMLPTGKSVKFSKFGFDTYTFLGLQPNPKEISFRLPPDFLIKPNQSADLTLNFTYSGGLRPESGLNILVNGVFATVIHFTEPDGGALEDYKIGLPTYLFKPGVNSMKFKPIMTPRAGKCELIQSGSLFVTVFDNSKLFFPNMPHFVKMPNLELFMLNGYPFTVWPDGFESMIYLADKEAPALSAAMNTVGMISQNNGYPLLAISVTTKFPLALAWRGNMMVFSTIGSLPKEILQNSNIKLSRQSSMKYPVTHDKSSKAFAFTRQISGMGTNTGALLELKSPFEQNKTILLFTAENHADLGKLGLAMTDSGVQATTFKGFALIEFLDPHYKVSSLQAGKTYFIGAESALEKARLYFYLNEHFVYWVGGLLAAFIIISSLMLYRHVLQRKGSEEDAEIGKRRMSVFRLIVKLLKSFFVTRRTPRTK